MAILVVVVLAAEMVNTMVEALVDLVTEEYHPLAKVAKDVAAGVVLLCAIGAAAVGVLIFLPNRPGWRCDTLGGLCGAPTGLFFLTELSVVSSFRLYGPLSIGETSCFTQSSLDWDNGLSYNERAAGGPDERAGFGAAEAMGLRLYQKGSI